jgi:hypothetical protein
MLNLRLLRPLLARADEVIEGTRARLAPVENVRVQGHYRGRSC